MSRDYNECHVTITNVTCKGSALDNNGCTLGCTISHSNSIYSRVWNVRGYLECNENDT